MSIASKIIDDPESVATHFAADFARWVTESNGQVNVSLSGGSTPQILFRHWASEQAPAVDWQRVHFFWGDERCVSAEHPDSNFGVANQLFFLPAGIPELNIHRIRGEDDIELERNRYEQEIAGNVRSENGWPQFDIMILGMGNDGHTASIFPNQMDLLSSDSICGIAKHPDSQQPRITLTGNVIANARRIVFLITGESKAEKVSAILAHEKVAESWPATQFFGLPATTIYLDRAAAS